MIQSNVEPHAGDTRLVNQRRLVKVVKVGPKQQDQRRLRVLLAKSRVQIDLRVPARQICKGLTALQPNAQPRLIDNKGRRAVGRNQLKFLGQQSVLGRHGERILCRLLLQHRRLWQDQWLNGVLAVVEVQALRYRLRLIDFPNVQPRWHQLREYGFNTLSVKAGKTVRRLDGKLRRVGLHGSGQLVGIGKVIHLFQKPEAILQRGAKFVGIAIIHTPLTQHFDIAQQHRRNVVAMRQPLGSQLH